MAAPNKGPERWKKLALSLTLINTFLTAIIAGLQVDASIRADGANRDSQYLALQVSAALITSGLQGNYDFSTYLEFLKNSQESLVMNFTSLDPELQRSEAAITNLTLQAAVAQARADRARALSIFFTDPRYAPSSEDQAPDFLAYLADTNAEAEDLVTQQNAASDAYHRWDSKSDAYVGVLSVLAIAFFMLGLAQAVAQQPRLVLALFALGLMAMGSLWSAFILLG
jgi:hypothetical protein